MCRLFASRSKAPIHVDRLLLDAKASLFALSHEHRDGWGIGQYLGGKPVLERGTKPAFEDPEFTRVARAVESTCTLAHIRRRSVGDLTVEDNHPFQRGRFLFAHNGTVQRFGEIGPSLEQLIDPAVRAQLRGTTDSERCFSLFLTRLKTRLGKKSPALEDLAEALAQTVFAIRSYDPGPGKHHMLTFLVTDGEHLVGIRSGEKELWLSKDDSNLFLASEPLSQEDRWERVADGEIVGISGDLSVRRFRVDDFTPEAF